ncbi:MAG TPA: hypothetical protein VFV38_19280, partial [Ktedonobacteraceae bacterium]|nr:hypothetical protein [Ktedonobacteraceae bacterium]
MTDIPTLLAYLAGAKEKLQAIENGSHPHIQSLKARRESSGWTLEFVLAEVAEALPASIRCEVETCIAITKRVWSAEYRDAYLD